MLDLKALGDAQCTVDGLRAMLAVEKRKIQSTKT